MPYKTEERTHQNKVVQEDGLRVCLLVQRGGFSVSVVVCSFVCSLVC